MKTLTILSLLFIWGCSSKPKVSSDLYLKLNLEHWPKHMACMQHRDKLVAVAYTEAEYAELDDEHFFFVRNETIALKFINQFDLTKFTLKENQEEYQAIVQGCVLETDKKHKTCDTMYPTYKFFRAMIYGLRQYPWTDATKRKATQLILNYLDYVARSNPSLMDITYANDLLRRLAEHAYIDPQLYFATWDFKTIAEKKMDQLRESVQKLGKKKLSCKDANSFYDEEREKVKELTEIFMKILQKAQVV